MRRVILAVIVPVLIILGSFIGFLALKSLGLFPNNSPWYFSLTVPVCVYLSALIIWLVNPAQRDIVPSLVAGSAFLGFLIGAILLTNFVGLGLNPIPVLEIFFSQTGLNQTLPYFLKNFDSPNLPNLDQPIFLFLMTPIAISIVGIVLSCFVQFKKPELLRDRTRPAAIRAIVGFSLLLLLWLVRPA